MFVRDWMTDLVVTVLPNTKLQAAVNLMNERKIRRVPVVDGKRLVGIITKSDIYAALGPLSTWDKTEAEEQTVDAHMTRGPITVAPGNTLEEAALVMHDRRVSGLPVLDRGKLAGVITETDIFRAFVEIMGIREGGARIAMQLKPGAGILEQIKKRAGRLVVRSLVTYHDPKKKTWRAIIRVRGRQ
ncbi:MAG: CBS domain-containing protein [Planctomycetota bacterium]|jgi:acetoin utilization protein AcuB